MKQESFKYYAFISYSHKDKKIARKLQRRLERYHLPSALQRSYQDLPKKLSPVFIDDSDLIGRGTLKTALQENLDLSNYLIVVCSPNSARSEYVNDEVDYFIKNGRGDRIIPLIIDGTPHASDTSQECFPPSILALPREKEPLGIDLKQYGMRYSFLRVIATILKLDLDEFITRDARERKRKIMIFTPIAAAIAIIAGLLAWYSVTSFDFFSVSDPAAQNGIALTYYVKHDYIKAAEWFEKAAAQGNADAQTFMGNLYRDGLGVEQDYIKAKEWHEKASAQGHADAQFNLGYLYQEGLGVGQDYEKAREWYEKAAAQGHTHAVDNLVYLYENVKFKYEYSIEKYAEQGDADSQFALALMYEDVERDYVKAREWLEKAAAQGHTNAQISLAYLYTNGLGVERDYLKAMEWYEKAATQGDTHAQFNIAYLYEKGLGVEQDYLRAAEWYEKAAVQGNASAQSNLGYFYINGLGVGQDYEKAREWYRKAAAQGNAGAINNLEFLKEAEWYEKAAAQGDVDALRQLADMYEHGAGVERNHEKAAELLQKASEDLKRE